MKASLLGRTAAALLTAGALLWSTSAGAAGHANNFGDKGQLIITADRLLPLFSFSYASTTQTTPNGQDLTHSRSGSGISLLLGKNLALPDDPADFPVNVHTLPRIAADFTIIDHLTLGAGIAIGFGLGGTDKTDIAPQNGGVKTTQSADAPHSTAFGIAPRVGYVIPFADILAFWPRVGLGVYSVSSKIITTPTNVPTTTSTTDTLFSLDLDPQLVIVPIEHFFFTVGPIINIPLSGSRTTNTTQGSTTQSTSQDLSLFNFGISAGIGGWFNM